MRLMWICKLLLKFLVSRKNKSTPEGVQRRDMIEVSIAKLVSSVIAIILSSISIGMSISGLMSLREKRPSKKPVEDRDNKTGRTDK